MRLVRTPREEMEPGISHQGAAPRLFKSCFAAADFKTPWHFIHCCVFPPGSGIGHHRHLHAEELFVTVDNAAQFTHNGRTTEVTGAAAVPLRSGESHAIYNHTQSDTRFYNFKVVDLHQEPVTTNFDDNRADAPLESADRLPIGRLDRTLLKPAQSHGGKGEILVRMVWTVADFTTNFGFLAHAIMPPGTSVGYHRHDTIEEVYVIMNGCGRMTMDDATEEVHPGDVILNRLGGSHGIYNHTDEELEFFAVAVCMKKGQTDATNHGDDLTDR